MPDWERQYARYAKEARRGRGARAASGARALARTLAVGLVTFLGGLACLWLFSAFFQTTVQELRNTVFYVAATLFW
jgi:hypothetical protein